MKILYLVSEDYYFLRHRKLLGCGMRDLGAEVFVMAHSNGREADLRALGFHFIPWNFTRGSMNLFREVRSAIQVFREYRRIRPDIVHHVAIKPVAHGGVAARWFGIPSVNAITGLGHAFITNSAKMRVLRTLWLKLLGIAMRPSQAIAILQNPDNRDLLISAGAISSQRSVLILGSGVDTVKFTCRPEPQGDPVVILPARFLWSKGVREFVDAARLLREQGVRARFMLVGATDPENPATVSGKQIQQWSDEGVVEVLGWQTDDDMPNVLNQATIIAYPSYAEGLPRCLLEAAACGRPIVATDVPGCREVVRHGFNGFLVPPRDPVALASAIGKLLQNPALRRDMGHRSRILAVESFNNDVVLQQTLAVYRRLLGDKWQVRGPVPVQV